MDELYPGDEEDDDFGDECEIDELLAEQVLWQRGERERVRLQER